MILRSRHLNKKFNVKDRLSVQAIAQTSSHFVEDKKVHELGFVCFVCFFFFSVMKKIFVRISSEAENR